MISIAPAARSRRARMGARGLGVVATLVVLAGCGADTPIDGRPLIAVSVPPLAFVVEQLAGNRVRVEAMLPPGASPVTYEPTIRQLRSLEQARLFVAVGHPAFPFESSWLAPLLAEAPDVPVVNTVSSIAHVDEDPHVWVVPRTLDALAVHVEAELEKLLPNERETLSQNLDRLRIEIEEVDRELRTKLGGPIGRRFLVLHPAWGHLASEYGLEQVAIERGHKSPDLHSIARLIEASRAAAVKVIFVQPQFDPTAAELVARAVGARVAELDPLARDWSANMRHVAHSLAEGLYR